MHPLPGLGHARALPRDRDAPPGATTLALALRIVAPHHGVCPGDHLLLRRAVLPTLRCTLAQPRLVRLVLLACLVLLVLLGRLTKQASVAAMTEAIQAEAEAALALRKVLVWLARRERAAVQIGLRVMRRRQVGEARCV